MGHQIVAVGEVLWDLLPKGKQLGSAPANFTYHCRSLGGDALLVTRVGNDALGHEVLERFRLLGLPTDTVQIDPDFPTGTVEVALAEDGQPRFTILENVAWDRITADAGADPRCQGGRRLLRQPLPAERAGTVRQFARLSRPPARPHCGSST